MTKFLSSRLNRLRVTFKSKGITNTNFNKLTLLILFIYITKQNITSCGSISEVTSTTNLQEFIHSLNDEEADVFARHLQFQPPQGGGTNQLVSTNFPWQSLLLFLAATSVLFIWARYGDVIQDLIFNLPSDAYTGLARGMRLMGQAALHRANLVETANNLLNDPTTAGRVHTAINTVRELQGHYD